MTNTTAFGNDELARAAAAVVAVMQAHGATDLNDLIAKINAQHVLLPEETAAKLRTTPANLAQMRFRGDGPKFIKRGRRVLYRQADIDAYLNENTRTSTGGA